MLGIKFRNAAKLNTDLIERLRSLTLDTARLNRQVSFFYKSAHKFPPNSKIESTTEHCLNGSNFLKEKESNLGAKQTELEAKERELQFRELELKSKNANQNAQLLNPNVEATYKKIKSSLGSYGVDNVSTDSKGGIFEVTIPTHLLFVSDGKEVQGKGLAILIKLTEVLKQQPVFVKIVNETKKNINNTNSWNLATQQVAEAANVMGRYGFPSQNIMVSVRESTNSESSMSIYVSYHSFQ